jgi:hypothetical protein
MPIVTEYRGFTLTAVEQPAGGYRVEIIPAEGGKPVLTTTFAEQSAAMASARAIIDYSFAGPA